MAHIALDHVCKRYGAVEVLRDVSLDIHECEFMVIVGPSGCGKSTLIRAIAGFEAPTSGEIRFDGVRMNETPPSRRGLAMVFQNYALYPHMSGHDNIAFGLRNLGTAEAEVKKRVQEIAETLHIELLLDRRPDEMSGGQRQRVAIARAIIRSPRVFLFDEPLSNLDAALRGQMRVELARLHQRLPVSTVFVTHDQIEAMTLADRIAVLNKGQVEQVGPPLMLYHRPKNMFVASFLGSPPMNFMPATLLRATSEYADVRLETGGCLRSRANGQALLPQVPVMVGIRPEHMKLTELPEGLPARVNVVEELGSRRVIYVTLVSASFAQADCIVEEDGRPSDPSGKRRVAPQDMIRISADPRSVHLFTQEGDAVLMLDPFQPHVQPS